LSAGGFSPLTNEATTLARGETPHTMALWTCERELQARLLDPALGADLLRLVRILS
jgi:hypothetical protein